ncbi:MAG: tetratricopeptide repeat protein, partial [Pseudomonadota bacterium]
VDDKNVNVICMLAQLLIAEEKLDQAISLLQAAIEEANEEAELWRCVGDAMSAKEDWANAKTFYEEALRLDASLQPAIDGLAKIGETKDTEAAVH